MKGKQVFERDWSIDTVSVPLRGNGMKEKLKEKLTTTPAVSVPLRGNGMKVRKKLFGSTLGFGVFPSPCGVMA